MGLKLDPKEHMRFEWLGVKQFSEVWAGVRRGAIGKKRVWLNERLYFKDKEQVRVGLSS